MNLKFSWAYIFATFLFVANGLCADPFGRADLKEVRELHAKAQGGDKESTKKLVETLEKAVAEHPQDAMFRVYLGSAYTLTARDAFVFDQMDWLEKGLKTMDAAVEMSPEDVAVRFVRAVNHLMLPAIVGRRAHARADFGLLLERIQTNPELLDAGTRQAIHYYAGLSLNQTDEPDKAREVWNQGIAIDPSTEKANQIRAEIEKMDHAPKIKNARGLS